LIAVAEPVDIMNHLWLEGTSEGNMWSRFYRAI